MEGRNPTIIVPFSPADSAEVCRDVFVYLRPESNGIEVESLIMQAIRAENLKDSVKLSYLANLPGDFIASKGLIEHHYRIRLLFAVKGKNLFTRHMKKVFKSYFRCSFDKADILGPYEAMKRLGVDEETLFKTWVKPSNMLNINGQSIKKINNLFVLNYDIPALLKKNDINTDIAVMIFRCCRKDEDIHYMIDAIEAQLKSRGIVNVMNPSSRIFHYSKGPFEELLDCSGFLYNSDLKNIPLSEVTFGRYLLENGVEIEQIEGALYHPIMYFKPDNGSFVENDIYSYTKDLSYAEALERFKTVFLQRVIQ
ncbi:MAG: hypothetical protein PQJ61_16070 [Spirochaetales bacterium]|uniref:Uncharacterized protein n=1 Tax=Candidatus Thalassospirochaeta sargassi TaxID=3119039 RepID=A0AAJ1IHI8_9SPIO|nr:hypothetical protein [Spirochaetales bacterium]